MLIPKLNSIIFIYRIAMYRQIKRNCIPISVQITLLQTQYSIYFHLILITGKFNLASAIHLIEVF